MTNTEYLKPTKTNPVFKAECDFLGYIENPRIKMHIVNNNIGDTFETDFTNAITKLHEYIKQNNLHMEYPKAKFNIYLVDGTIDKKLDSPKLKKVYTISSKKATELL